jgi:hypothetical protein
MAQNPPLSLMDEYTSRAGYKFATLSELGRSLTQPTSGLASALNAAAQQDDDDDDNDDDSARAMSRMRRAQSVQTPEQPPPAVQISLDARRSRRTESDCVLLDAHRYAKSTDREQVHSRYLSIQEIHRALAKKQSEVSSGTHLSEKLARCGLLYEFVSDDGGQHAMGRGSEGALLVDAPQLVSQSTQQLRSQPTRQPSTNSASLTHPSFFPPPPSPALPSQPPGDDAFVPFSAWKPPKELTAEYQRLRTLLEDWRSRNKAAGCAIRNLARAKVCALPIRACVTHASVLH